MPSPAPTATRRKHRLLLRAGRALLLLMVLILTGTACGYGSRANTNTNPDPQTKASAAPARRTSADEIRIGFFANLTHTTPLIGLDRGFLRKELGSTRIRTQVFNAGPAEIEALNSGALDLGWIGPSPAVNGYAQSGGRSLRIIAGATSGGAALVVNPKKIKSIDDLKGRTLASPQLGNTQDVALRAWLADRGHPVSRNGSGTVRVQPTQNADTLRAYQRGDIDGAWLPEPWASRLVVEAGAKVLLDERKLWPDGRFVSTNLIVSTRFLSEHPDTVEAVIRAQLATNTWINLHPAKARTAVNRQLKKYAGSPLPPAVLNRAWRQLTITDDPLAATLRTQAKHSAEAGLTKPTDLRGIYDLTLLNKHLRSTGRPPASDAGLGPR
jgi:NitT/TauT family transport system substrate-binding protein